MVPTNWFDRQYRTTAQTRTWVRRYNRTIGSRRRRLGYHGIIKKDPQYQGTIDFSTDDGYTFSNPAVNVLGNRVIQMRLTLAQHQVQPLIMGWELRWHLPNGWVWTDRLDRITFERNNSNPMVVTRTIRSPANPVPVGFRVIIAHRYYG